MNVLLIGATGYIGHAVAEALARNGHKVLALARSDEAEKRLAEKGYEVARGDVRDPAGVAALVVRADATILAATTNSEDGGAVDAALTRALLAAHRGTGKPFVYTSGAWTLGDTGAGVADERASVLTPLPLVAWRAAVEADVVAAARDGVHAVLLRPAVAYGRGGGIPSGLVREARTAGGVRVVGDGRQEWPVVHVDDLAELYVRALAAPAGSILHGADGQHRARDVAVAAALGAGAGGRTLPWTVEEARADFGAFGEFFALHQRVDSAATRALTGWSPTRPSLVEELAVGSYAR